MSRIEPVKRAQKRTRPVVALNLETGESLWLRSVNDAYDYTGVTRSRIYRRLGSQGQISCDLDGWRFKFAETQEEDERNHKRVELEMKLDKVTRKVVDELRAQCELTDVEILEIINKVCLQGARYATTIHKGE